MKVSSQTLRLVSTVMNEATGCDPARSDTCMYTVRNGVSAPQGCKFGVCTAFTLGVYLNAWCKLHHYNMGCIISIMGVYIFKVAVRQNFQIFHSKIINSKT